MRDINYFVIFIVIYVAMRDFYNPECEKLFLLNEYGPGKI